MWRNYLREEKEEKVQKVEQTPGDAPQGGLQPALA